MRKKAVAQNVYPALELGKRKLTVQQAELSFRIETEGWDEAKGCLDYLKHPLLVLALELRCGAAEEGEDTACAELYLKLKSGTPANLEGRALGPNVDEVEVWWEQELLELEQQDLELRSPLKGDKLELSWSAAAKNGVALKFEGQVDFQGLSLKAKTVSDAQDLLARAWPALKPEAIELVGEVELGFVSDSEDEMEEEAEEEEEAKDDSWVEVYYSFK